MRPEKQAIIDQVARDVENADFVIFTDYTGLTVENITDLRKLLYPLNTRVNITKNTYIKKASKEFGSDEVSLLLTGPTAMVSGTGEVTDVASVLSKFRKETTLLSVKGGWVGGEVLGAEDMAVLASIPPRPVMLGKLVGTVAAPLMQFVGVFNQKVCSLLYVLKAVEEKKSKG